MKCYIGDNKDSYYVYDTETYQITRYNARGLRKIYRDLDIPVYTDIFMLYVGSNLRGEMSLLEVQELVQKSIRLKFGTNTGRGGFVFKGRGYLSDVKVELPLHVNCMDESEFLKRENDSLFAMVKDNKYFIWIENELKIIYFSDRYIISCLGYYDGELCICIYKNFSLSLIPISEYEFDERRSMSKGALGRLMLF